MSSCLCCTGCYMCCNPGLLCDQWPTAALISQTPKLSADAHALTPTITCVPLRFGMTASASWTGEQAHLAKWVQVQEPVWLCIQLVPEPCLGILQGYLHVSEGNALLEQRNPGALGKGTEPAHRLCLKVVSASAQVVKMCSATEPSGSA